jgi:hypothetical protein
MDAVRVITTIKVRNKFWRGETPPPMRLRHVGERRLTWGVASGGVRERA